MINKQSITYSLRNMKNQKSRSALTVFSILIGITTLFLFISFGLGLQNFINEIVSDSSANKIIIQAKGIGVPGLDTTFKLTDKDIKAIEKTPGITEASGMYIKAVEIKQDSIIKYSFLTAYDPKVPIILDISNIGITKGRPLRKGDTKKVTLGYNFLLENKIFPKKYKVGDKIEIQGTEMRIVGFFEEIGNPQDDSNVYMTNDYFTEFFPEVDTYGMLVAESSNEDMDQVVEKVEESLRKSRNLKVGKEDFSVQSYQELLNSFLGIINIVYGFIILIALISVAVSSINTANTMITSVLERYKEIGILKAIGAKNSEIFNIFLFESSFLGFIAGSIGVFFGWILAYAATYYLTEAGFSSLAPAYPYYLFIGCILFATITGAISGVFPAINASKTNTVDALRYE